MNQDLINGIIKELPSLDIGSASGTILHSFIDITECTKYPTIFFPICRELTRNYPIYILRNDHDARAGFYLVGREKIIPKVRAKLQFIIEDVEYDVFQVWEKRDYQNLHGNAALSKVRMDGVNAWLEELRKLEPFLDYKYQRSLLLSYINSNTLKYLKKFK